MPDPAESVSVELLDEMLMLLIDSVAFEIHRDIHAGPLGLVGVYGCQALLAAPADASSSDASKALVVCPSCGAKIAATKFAGHYARCGQGGSGRRSRKANGSGTWSPSRELSVNSLMDLPSGLAEPAAPEPTNIRLRMQMIGDQVQSIVSVQDHHGLPTVPRETQPFDPLPLEQESENDWFLAHLPDS